MKHNRISFDYGIFEYKNERYVNGPVQLPLIRGNFSLNIKPIKNDFNGDFWFYDLIKLNEYDWYKNNQNQFFNRIFCLGPYYPYWIQNELSKNSPLYTSVLLYSKTSKIIEATQSQWSDNWKYKGVEGRKEQLKIFTNFFGHFLIKAQKSLTGFLISVPAKPSYSLNSVECITKELSQVFSLPIKEILIRISNDNKIYDLKQGNHNSVPSEVILVDDLFTNGETKRFICNLLRNNGAKNITIICLGRTDHNDYY